jgi:hypothetical protein
MNVYSNRFIVEFDSERDVTMPLNFGVLSSRG